MANCTFIDGTGSFELKGAQRCSGLYFPLAGEYGMKSSLTPDLAGDAKLDQNHFLLPPVSIENLHNDRSSRNFWCIVEQKSAWSVTGQSAAQAAKKFTEEEEEVTVRAGYMWHQTSRISRQFGLTGSITSYIPIQKNIEVHIITITNQNKTDVTFVPVAAFPIYGRSADNIRDHRHVTSLLHRVTVTDRGVNVCPTLSFDERGHQVNDTMYFVEGITENGEAPCSFYPEIAEFIGEGGSLETPEAVIKNLDGVTKGTQRSGQEAFGGLRFARTTLEAGESKSYIIFAGTGHSRSEIRKLLADYPTLQEVQDEFIRVKQYWKNKVNVSYHTGDEVFDQFMNWVSFQPELRRLFGCSFLPHHDYGKGGRGWRDLWQDCLALLLMNPGGVRQMLLGNFAGVRMDGSNATIIGEHVGEFKADRNSITRVWMDHGVWPLITTKLYIDQTGDLDLLEQPVRYFKDGQVMRGTDTDAEWKQGDIWQKDVRQREYTGSVLEHLLIQNLTAFLEVGEHNQIRLRDADWNDAIDMAGARGESVAFTNAYAMNLLDLADLIEEAAKRGKKDFMLLQELEILLKDDPGLYESIEEKNELLKKYLHTCRHYISGVQIPFEAADLVRNLRGKGNWMLNHIRQNEWVTDGAWNGWFNGYYDNSGHRVEGVHDGNVRMMLTGQVFAIMARTATDEQIAAIVKSADTYLYDESCGGYRLNTDFGEIKTDMGRMFGFAYGEKENGAVFSHMAVMFANALYQRGYAKEGYKALHSLYMQSMDFERSHIYPGIPEYFGRSGRGLYHYLTGAASWYMMTVINQMFGIRGCLGDLLVEPKLLAEQFDEDGLASLAFRFQGMGWYVIFENSERKDYGQYHITKVCLDDKQVLTQESGSVVLKRELLAKLDTNITHKISVKLN